MSQVCCSHVAAQPQNTVEHAPRMCLRLRVIPLVLKQDVHGRELIFCVNKLQFISRGWFGLLFTFLIFCNFFLGGGWSCTWLIMLSYVCWGTQQLKTRAYCGLCRTFQPGPFCVKSSWMSLTCRRPRRPLRTAHNEHINMYIPNQVNACLALQFHGPESSLRSF